MFAKNVLIKLVEGSLEEFIGKEELWQVMGPFHLKFEKWSKSKHSRPSVIEGYRRWIKIKNLPLDYWSNQTFKVIGDHFGGLKNIASKMLNLLNVFEAKIQVKRNQCDFVPATLEITNFNQGNFFLHFGDFEQIEPPPLTKGHLSFENFSNSFDLQRLNQVLKDEGVDGSFFPEGVEYLRLIRKIPSCIRNPFEALEQEARQNLALSASNTSLEATMNLNLDSKESNVNTIRFEEPRYREKNHNIVNFMSSNELIQ